MDNRSEMVLKGFLSRCNPNEMKALERFLPEGERLQLSEMAQPNGEISPESFSSSSILDKVHWSWLLPTLKTYPEKEQRLFLSALPEASAESLMQSLELQAEDEEITETARAFLREQLLHSLVGPGEMRLPAPFLPDSPANALLHLSKKELIRLIDFLSLFDLAAEIRQIVETKILKKIYSFLTEEQKSALKRINPSKESLGPHRLGLDRWDGTEEALRNLLHKKGIARLAIALHGQHPDLVWTICHHLDIGRGHTLFRLSEQEAPQGAPQVALQQMEEMLGLL